MIYHSGMSFFSCHNTCYQQSKNKTSTNMKVLSSSHWSYTSVLFKMVVIKWNLSSSKLLTHAQVQIEVQVQEIKRDESTEEPVRRLVLHTCACTTCVCGPISRANLGSQHNEDYGAL